jgi:hypothetical protein
VGDQLAMTSALARCGSTGLGRVLGFNRSRILLRSSSGQRSERRNLVSPTGAHVLTCSETSKREVIGAITNPNGILAGGGADV